MKDKLLSLQKHLQTVQNQLLNPSKKHKGSRLEYYKEWAELEIRRTKNKIEELRLS